MTINPSFKRFIALIGVLAFFLSQTPIVNSADSRPSIVILLSKNILPYGNATSGFKSGMRERGFNPLYTNLNLDAMPETRILRKAMDAAPDLIFAVGTEAALFAKENFSSYPVVFSMVLDPVESNIVESFSYPGGNLTGVALKIKIETQFRKLQQIFPNMRYVGMLYDANKKVALKNEAQRAAEDLGLALIAKPVYSRRDVVGQLDEVLREADVLWAGVDTLIYNPQSAEHILLATLRNNVPFMAFSSPYVKAGALMALECDYVDIGRQSSNLVTKIINGRDPSDIPVEWPRKVKLITNKNTAKEIGVTIPRWVYDED